MGIANVYCRYGEGGICKNDNPAVEMWLNELFKID